VTLELSRAPSAGVPRPGNATPERSVRDRRLTAPAPNSTLCTARTRVGQADSQHNTTVSWTSQPVRRITRECDARYERWTNSLAGSLSSGPCLSAVCIEWLRLLRVEQGGMPLPFQGRSGASRQCQAWWTSTRPTPRFDLMPLIFFVAVQMDKALLLNWRRLAGMR